MWLPEAFTAGCCTVFDMHADHQIVTLAMSLSQSTNCRHKIRTDIGAKFMIKPASFQSTSHLHSHRKSISTRCWNSSWVWSCGFISLLLKCVQSTPVFTLQKLLYWSNGPLAAFLPDLLLETLKVDSFKMFFRKWIRRATRHGIMHSPPAPLACMGCM